MKIAKLLDTIQSKHGFKHGSPQTDEQIAAAEKTIGLTFPEQYKHFLRRFGHADWDEGYIFGLSEDQYLDIVHRTNQARTEALPVDFSEFPKDAIPVEDYGGGGYYMLFCNESPRANQVGLFITETMNFEAQTYSSFEEYLKEMAE